MCVRVCTHISYIYAHQNVTVLPLFVHVKMTVSKRKKKKGRKKIRLPAKFVLPIYLSQEILNLHKMLTRNK